MKNLKNHLLSLKNNVIKISPNNKGGKRLTTRGMSIIELLVYMAMLVLLLGAIIQSVLIITTNYRAVRNTREIEDSAISVLDKITRVAHSADSISAASSTFLISPGAATFVATDSATGQSTTTRFYVSGDKMYVTENGISQGVLTNESVKVIGFTLYQINTSNSVALKIELSLLSDEATPAVISKNFYSTVILRGSYQ